MTSYENFAGICDWNTYVRLNVFHFVRGRHDYNMIHTFPFNVLSAVLDSREGDNCDTNLDSSRSYSLRPGEIILIPSNTRIHYFAQNTCKFVAAHFNLTFLSNIDLFRELKEPVIIRDPDLFRELTTLPASKDDDIVAICRLKSVIWTVAARYLPKIDEWKIIAEQKYRSIFRYIEDHLDAQLTVGAVAASARCRADVFARQFHQSLGITPKKFIEESLLQKITQQLLSSDQSIKEIAEKYHFCSEFYFSAFFKRYIGVSPGTFRKKFSSAGAPRQ